MNDITIRPVDPEADADLIHDWVTQERARFWGMLDKDRDEVLEIYTYIAEQAHLSAHLVSVGGVPVTLFQTYDPAVDDIGQYYDREAGDVGVHLLLADSPARIGRTQDIVAFLMGWLFDDPANLRIVLEPDTRNAKSLRLFGLAGAEAGPEVQMPQKRAQFAFIDRQALARA
jgi:RimJ/RimL family protein N-acetyltransferase